MESSEVDLDDEAEEVMAVVRDRLAPWVADVVVVKAAVVENLVAAHQRGYDSGYDSGYEQGYDQGEEHTLIDQEEGRSEARVEVQNELREVVEEFRKRRPVGEWAFLDELLVLLEDGIIPAAWEAGVPVR